jgi:glycosyltransferase involved in cell wall biosynthesis
MNQQPAANFDDRKGTGFMASRHIVYLDGQADQVVNFRETLLKMMVAHGWDVTVMASLPNARDIATLESWGVRFVAFDVDRTGMNPVKDVVGIFKLTAALRQLAPDVFFGCSFKPVVYGVLAARFAGVRRRYAMLPGMGYAFAEGREFRRRAIRVLLSLLLKLSLRVTGKLIVQNADDLKLFQSGRLLANPEQAVRVAGSGVDLLRFKKTPLPSLDRPLTFLMIARLLRDKGLVEFVDAAKCVKRKHPNTRFVLVGPYDSNPTGVGPEIVEGWVRDGAIEYGGAVEDVRPFLADCHVFVLPSYYREGTPRTILEAMATGRPIITTDSAGCRETVVDGRNGILVAPRDATSLETAMIAYVNRPDDIAKHADESRKLVEKTYDAVQVSRDVMRHLELFDPAEPRSLAQAG